MVGLRDRAEAAGGTLTISSPPGGGTGVSAVLPLAGCSSAMKPLEKVSHTQAPQAIADANGGRRVAVGEPGERASHAAAPRPPGRGARRAAATPSTAPPSRSGRNGACYRLDPESPWRARSAASQVSASETGSRVGGQRPPRERLHGVGAGVAVDVPGYA